MAHVTDEEIQQRIEALVAEEHELQNRGAGTGLSDEDHERLEAVRVELDRQWDLLRQRRAREEFGLDPDVAQPRDPSTVENYKQ